ncbi:MAG: hypothetical protein GF398_06100, partial [Chitinivibrionales bacterium]|nr:hypothetical protein [Chitinivibrionales bacterium]
DGLETVRTEGTPQGSPLSPLLSNIMLDDLDKELQRRNHKFVRYADDCNIYVKSRGLDEVRAWRSATNGRGPWWNAGASHMNEAFKKADFDKMGLTSLFDRFITTRNQSRTAVYGTVRTVV